MTVAEMIQELTYHAEHGRSDWPVMFINSEGLDDHQATALSVQADKIVISD